MEWKPPGARPPDFTCGWRVSGRITKIILSQVLVAHWPINPWATGRLHASPLASRACTWCLNYFVVVSLDKVLALWNEEQERI
jgi:hypothetical protein